MPARLHLTFIVHGARADNPELRHVVSWVRQRGHAVNVRVTWETGDGIHLAAEAADRGTDVVIACGGDGTLNEVVNGLARRTTSLGRRESPRTRIMPWMLSCGASPCGSTPHR
jgi:diacylglycerol kinase family enzyme